MTFRRVFTKIRKYRRGLGLMFTPQYLIYTNVVLSSCMSTLGDCLEQTYEIHTKEISKYDLYRTAHMTASGGCTGILCHMWYKVVDRVIKGRTFDMVVKKIFLDQCIASPIMIMSFFATVAIFEENPWENFTDEVQDKFWILYKAEWTVWPPAQIINFYFLPTKYRVLYDNTISLGYDVYTSRVKHDKSLSESKTRRKSEQEERNEKND